MLEPRDQFAPSCPHAQLVKDNPAGLKPHFSTTTVSTVNVQGFMIDRYKICGVPRRPKDSHILISVVVASSILFNSVQIF